MTLDWDISLRCHDIISGSCHRSAWPPLPTFVNITFAANPSTLLCNCWPSFVSSRYIHYQELLTSCSPVIGCNICLLSTFKDALVPEFFPWHYYSVMLLFTRVTTLSWSSYLKNFIYLSHIRKKILIDIDIILFSCLSLWVRLIHIEWFGLSPVFTVFFICESDFVVTKSIFILHWWPLLDIRVCMCDNVVSWWSWRSMTWFCHHTSTHCASPSSSCVTPPP